MNNHIWNPSVGDGRDCRRDSTNTNDRYAVYLLIYALCFAEYFRYFPLFLAVESTEVDRGTRATSLLAVAMAVDGN